MTCRICEWSVYPPNGQMKRVFKVRPISFNVQFEDKEFDDREGAYQYAKELGFKRVYGRKGK